MPTIDRTQFYSGGFFLVRAGKTDLFEDNLLPPKVITLSPCIGGTFDSVWTWGSLDEGLPYINTRERVEAFGINLEQWDEIKTWCSTQQELEYLDIYGVFTTISSAREFINKFLADTTDLHLLEIGLPRELATADWFKRTQVNGESFGIDKLISQKIPLSTDSEILGFEVLSYDYHNLGHTWLCSYLHRDMHKLYGIKPNQYGLIDDYNDAKKVYEWIAEDDMKGRRAEPEPYDFWLVISHPLTEQ